MLTEIRRNKEDIFNEDMITKCLKIYSAHNDGITSI